MVSRRSRDILLLARLSSNADGPPVSKKAEVASNDGLGGFLAAQQQLPSASKVQGWMLRNDSTKEQARRASDHRPHPAVKRKLVFSSNGHNGKRHVDPNGGGCPSIGVRSKTLNDLPEVSPANLVEAPVEPALPQVLLPVSDEGGGTVDFIGSPNSQSKSSDAPFKITKTTAAHVLAEVPREASHTPLSHYEEVDAEIEVIEEVIIADTINTSQGTSTIVNFEVTERETDFVDLNLPNDEINIQEQTPTQPRRKTMPPRENTRKRSRNNYRWKRSVAKQAVARGEEHVNGTGKLIGPKKMGSGCSKQSCRFKCHDNISEEERQTIFNAYWRLEDQTRKWDFINRLTTVVSPKERKGKGGDDRVRERKYTKLYHLNVGEKVVKVCRTMFLSTLDVSEQVLKTATTKLVDNNFTKVSPDKRGKHGKHKKIPESVKMSARHHIESLPRVPSHYCRARSKRMYLETDLKIPGLYAKYEDWMTEKYPGEEKASQRVYADIFNEEYNLSPFKSKKDLCDVCLTFNSKLTKNQQALAQEDFNIHLKRKEEARNVRQADKVSARDNSKICLSTFDLQKVHTVPQDEAGSLFYACKLSMYNFTIWEVTRREGYCYVWHEGEAYRGANEVASSVLQYIDMKMRSNEGIEEFIFWSDNCSGQNKNKFLFSMYTYASATYNVNITHRYLEKGHTENAGDCMHSNIERFGKKKKMYVPEEWYTNILLSSTKIEHQTENGKKIKQRVPAYKLVRMKDLIYDFHVLADTHQKWSGHKDVSWKPVREIKTFAQDPSKISLRYDFNEDAPVKVNVSKAVRGRPFHPKNFKLQKAFNGPVRLTAKKLKHLWTMCKKNTIPSEYWDFYKTLIGFPNLEEEDVDVIDDPERQRVEENIMEVIDEMAADYNIEEEWLVDDPLREEEN